METVKEKAALSVEGSCRYLDISRPTLYRLMDSGAIPFFHIGRRRLLLRTHLDQYVQDRLTEAKS